MKRICILLISMGMVSLGNAQKVRHERRQPRQESVKAETQSPETILAGIVCINQQIDSLKGSIHREYNGFSTQKLYTDEKFRNDSLASIDKEKESLKNKIKDDTCVINSLKEEYKAVDRIREYYEKGNIDTLYAHADLMTLHIHKNIFGDSYPKVMDDLKILLECTDLFAKEYDDKQNKTHIQNLKEVRQCDTKEQLEGFLLVHKDITDEVNSWIKDEEHTLYSMMMFRRYLYNNYGITIDADFPYLNAKVIEILKLPSPTK